MYTNPLTYLPVRPPTDVPTNPHCRRQLPRPDNKGSLLPSPRPYNRLDVNTTINLRLMPHLQPLHSPSSCPLSLTSSPSPLTPSFLPLTAPLPLTSLAKIHHFLPTLPPFMRAPSASMWPTTPTHPQCYQYRVSSRPHLHHQLSGPLHTRYTPARVITSLLDTVNYLATPRGTL